MKIDTISDLEKTIKLCRKLGVSSIETDGVKLQLTELDPTPKRSRVKQAAPDKIESTDSYSDEDYLFWSADPQVP